MIFSCQYIFVFFYEKHENIINIIRNNDQVEKALQLKSGFSNQSYELFCERIKEDDVLLNISATELKQRIKKGEKLQFIDVRELNELPKITELEGLNIPKSEITQHISKIDRTLPVIFYCQSGKRSKQAIKELISHSDFSNLLNLEGGIKSWIKNNDITEYSANQIL